MEKVKICFFCINSTKEVFLCETCILEQRMKNYNFQLCYECLEKHSNYHHTVNTMTKLDIDAYISNKGNYTFF